MAELTERAVAARVPTLASQPLTVVATREPVAVPPGSSLGTCLRAIQRAGTGDSVFVTDAGGRRMVKGSIHVEMAVDAMYLADQIDQMVLFSGDGDFRSLVEAIQRRGVRVTVISTISSQPPMIADELRRQADVFTDLVELQSKLGRDPSERPAPREPRHHSPQFLQRATTVAPRGGDEDFDD